MTKIIKLISTAAAIALLSISFSGFSAKFEEGKHYSVVAKNKTLTPELTEYFSYYCPACRAYEPYLDSFKKVMPEQAKLNKVHVDFMGQTSPEIQFMLAKALIVAEKMGIDKQFNAEVFNYIQTKREIVSSEADVRKMFIAAGGDGAKFDKGMKSFSLVSKAKRNKKVQDKLSQGRYVKSVPTFVVNGKYVINSKELDPKNFLEEYKNIIAHLLTLK